MSGTTEIETKTQRETENGRIVQLVSSGASPQDDGDVVVWVRACEEPWAVKTGVRLTEDDAWELSDALRQAAQRVAGSEPQGFIRLQLLDDDAPGSTRLTPRRTPMAATAADAKRRGREDP